MKKILAIAIASAFAAPAFAATANVDVYGTFSMSVDSLNDGTDRGTNVSSNSSNIGFKGSEDLGGGLSAIWQVEQTLSLDSGGGLGGSGRDMFVGLKGGFGTIRLGHFDDATKQLSRKLDFFNNEIGDSRNLMRPSNNAGNSGNSWEERLQNGIRYDSPSFAGFSGSVHYSTQTSTTQASNNDTDAYDLGVKYENGPIMVGATYKKNNLTATTDESAWRIGGSFTMGDIKLNAIYHSASDQGGVTNADRKVWGLGAGYKMGNGLIKAHYFKADDVDTAANTGATMYAVGYDYSLSKRTKAYVAYAKTKNESAADFSVTSGGHGDNVGAAGTGGRDPSGFSVGVVHKF